MDATEIQHPPPAPSASQRHSTVPSVPPIVQAIDHIGEIVAVILAGILCLRGKLTSIEFMAFSGGVLGVQSGLRQIGRRVTGSAASGVVGAIFLGLAASHVASRFVAALGILATLVAALAW